MLNGLINYDINILFLKEEKDLQGNFLAGLHNNGKQFSIIIKGNDLNQNKQGGIWIPLIKAIYFQAVSFTRR